MKATAHLFLHYHNFIHQRQTFLDSLSHNDHGMLELNEVLQIDTLFFVENISYLESSTFFVGGLLSSVFH